MWATDSYLIDLSAKPESLLHANADRIFDTAWRFDLSTAGFCVLDLGPGLGSHDLRALMLDLKRILSLASERRGGDGFAIRSLGRFDQQETTKFHRDGAPDQSLLVLGYEPSKVLSRLALADLARCAHNMAIEPRRFLDDYNPMYRKGEELLIPYITELSQPVAGHSRIVLINNSSSPFSEARTN